MIDTARPGPWEPLRVPTFRALWLAVLVGNLGTWMHDTAAAWVMAELTAAPLMVAAVQAATTAPVVLLALAAGALADIVDRRRYLMLAQAWMLAVASLLALLAQQERLAPGSLLALTFALGIGTALAMPAQNATTAELVPRALLPPAVALGSLSMNVARALGPALGGVIVAQFGAAWAFGLNALSFVGIIVVLWRWRRAPSASALPPEHFAPALWGGLRYAAHAPVLQAVLARAVGFLLFASALAALLPIVVRSRLDGTAGLYGVLLGAIGAGAVAAALVLPRLRAHASNDRLIALATLAYAACMSVVAAVRSPAAASAAMLVAGFCWLTVLSSLQVTAQLAVPGWVRARALSLYVVAFAGSIAGGSILWGALAQQLSVSGALAIAAAGAVAAVPLLRRFRLAGAEALDTAPSAHWPQPHVAAVDDPDRGPVLVTVEYAVAPEQRPRFLELIQRLARSRRRDGALSWAVHEDSDDPGRYLETFTTGSWLDHLRQHERVDQDDHRLQEAIRALQREPGLPQVRHFVG